MLPRLMQFLYFYLFIFIFLSIENQQEFVSTILLNTRTVQQFLQAVLYLLVINTTHTMELIL